MAWGEMGWHGERWAAQSGKHHRLYLFVYDTWLRGTVNVRPRAPRDSPRSRRQSPVRRRARGRRDLSCSWAPDPRHVSRCRAAALPRPGGNMRHGRGSGCRLSGRTIPMFRLMFRLTRWASVRVTVPRLFQHLLLPHPLARPASGAPIDPSSVVPRHHAARACATISSLRA